MNPRRPLGLAAALGGVFLLGCGPGAIVAELFPLEYHVATELQAKGGPRDRRVTSCAIVDHSPGELLSSYRVEVGEDHALALPDGGVLLFPNVNPCRWRDPEQLPEFGLWFPFRPRGETGSGDWALFDTHAWWFNNPTDPTRLEIWSAHALLEGEAPWQIEGAAARAEGPATTTLAAAFPWLGGAPARQAAEAAETPPVRAGQRGPAPPSPHRFDGVAATAWRLDHGATCAGDPSGAPQLLGPESCRSLPECSGSGSEPCRRRIGGLTPAVSDDATRVDFDLNSARTGFRGAFMRRDTLPPGAPEVLRTWAPAVCLAGDCTPPANAIHPAWVWFPRTGVMLELDRDSRDLRWDEWTHQRKD